MNLDSVLEGRSIMSCNCARGDDSNDRRKVYEYAVKFVIGEIDDDAKEKVLPTGAYFTKINVHNFARCDCITFRWKVAVGHPRLRVGPVSDLCDAVLCPDEALEIGPNDIAGRIEGSKPTECNELRHVEGWVIILSPVELDIVAVYGTAANGQAPVTAFHTERVAPRCLPLCDDFHLDVSTGVSAWEYQGPGDTSFSPTTLVQPVAGWAAAMPGSVWIAPGPNRKAGDHLFRLRFKLCFGFREPKLDLRLMADNYANVFLNGQPVPPAATSGNMFTTPTNFSATSHFKAGDNELLIVVRNLEVSPVGLDVLGSISIREGLCEGAAMPLLPCPDICYRIHDRELWWNPFIGFVIDRDQRNWAACDGGTAGSNSGYRRAEQIEINLTGAIALGTQLEYRAFIRSVAGTTGWTGWTSSGTLGSSTPDHAITAIEVRLATAPVNCHVRYRVLTRRRLKDYDPSPTWSGYAYDGATAGTTAGIGWPQRFPPVVAVQIEIV